jgi:MFS family permease
VVHARHVVAALGSAVRNPDVRWVELAWGAAIAAEWAHFVAFGVFAYEEGGVAAVGVAGLVRLLPAALLAPFAASLGDRFPRERFLLALTLVGAAALVGSALAFAADAAFFVFAFAALLGLAVTLIRPALQALLPSLATTPDELIASNAATSTVESLGTLVGPLLAGLLISVADAGVVFAAGGGTLVAGALLLARVRVQGRIELPAAADDAGAGAALTAGFRALARAPRAPRRRPGRRADLRSRLPQRPDRRRRVPRPRGRRRGGRLHEGSDRSRWSPRRPRRDDARREAARRRLRLRPRLLGNAASRSAPSPRRS